MRQQAISIVEFELTDISLPEIAFRVVCSKGTYIRSLASDLGKALDSGAHLVGLRRTKSGNFDVSDALSMGEFEKWISEQAVNKGSERG